MSEDLRRLIDPSEPTYLRRGLDRIKRRPDGTLPSSRNYDSTAIPSPPTDLTLDSVGGRMFYVRRMLRVSRLTIENVAGLSRGHYGRFEYGHKQLTHIATPYRLVAAYFKLGVSVDYHWLVLGSGKHRDEPAYNENFWVRYPRERPDSVVLPAVEPGLDAVVSATRSGVGVKLTVGDPRLKLLPGGR